MASIWETLDQISRVPKTLKDIQGILQRGINPTPDWTSYLLNTIRGMIMDVTAQILAKIDAQNAAIADLGTKVGELPGAITKETDELKALLAKLQQGDTVDTPTLIAALESSTANLGAIAGKVSDAVAGIDAIVADSEQAPAEQQVVQ